MGRGRRLNRYRATGSRPIRDATRRTRGVSSTSTPSSSSSPLHTRSTVFRRPKNPIDPIRSDPTAPERTDGHRMMRWGRFSRSVNRSIAERPVDVDAHVVIVASVCARGEKNKQSQKRVVVVVRQTSKRTRPGWRRAWRGTSSFNRSCVDMSSTRSSERAKSERKVG